MSSIRHCDDTSVGKRRCAVSMVRWAPWEVEACPPFRSVGQFDICRIYLMDNGRLERKKQL